MLVLIYSRYLCMRKLKILLSLLHFQVYTEFTRSFHSDIVSNNKYKKFRESFITTKLHTSCTQYPPNFKEAFLLFYFGRQVRFFNFLQPTLLDVINIVLNWIIRNIIKSKHFFNYYMHCTTIILFLRLNINLPIAYSNIIYMLYWQFYRNLLY